MLGTYMFTIFMSSSFEHYEVSFCVSFYGLYFEVYFVWCKYCYLDFFFLSTCLDYFFFPKPSFSVCVSLLFWGGSFAGSMCVGHAFLSIQPCYDFWLENLIHLHLRLLLTGTYSLPFFCTCVSLSFLLSISISLSSPLSHPSVSLSLSFLFFITVPLTSLAVVALWIHTPLGFFSLGSSLIHHLFYMRVLLDRVVLDMGLCFSLSGISLPIPSGL